MTFLLLFAKISIDFFAQLLIIIKVIMYQLDVIAARTALATTLREVIVEHSSR
jgi:hypothetical protein